MRALLCCVVVGCMAWLGAGGLRAQSFSFSTAAGAVLQEGSVDGANGAARFRKPGALALDGAGNVYLADTYNHTIRKASLVAGQWVVTTLAGLAGHSGTNDGSNSVARFFFPSGIAVDSAGYLYVADTYNHSIRVIQPSGTNWVVSTLAGWPTHSGSQDGTGASAQFDLPYGVAVGGDGNVYVADTYNSTIRVVTPAGVVTTLAGYANNAGGRDGTNETARFDHPFGITVDGTGALYVADTYNCTIRKVTLIGPDWVVTTLAGVAGFADGADGTNNAAHFSYPDGVDADTSGNLYVADTSNHTIRKLTPAGTNWFSSTVGGTAGLSGSADLVGAAARFNLPRGVAVDAVGNLYIADTSNDTLRFGRPGFTLQTMAVGNQLVLSWSGLATNYNLETSGSVAPGSSWSRVMSGIFVADSSFVHTNTMGSGPVFYRLHKQ